MTAFNESTISEFRANGGRVGGPFEGAPLVLVHHIGRKSGAGFVIPTMYLRDAHDQDAIYIFASKAGAPTNPDWYHNLIAAGRTDIEIGTETYTVKVEELQGNPRDAVYAEQARRYAGFAEYAQQTKGIRTIPVLKLVRA